MPTNKSNQIIVRSVDGHVEVVGLSKEDVEYAIFLYQEVGNERVRARSAMASHVSQRVLGDGIELVSAASKLQIQRNAALRKELAENLGAYTYASLSALRGVQESSVRAWVSQARQQHELFTVALHGQTLIPQVQLTSTGNINPLVTDLVRPLILAKLDGWSIWSWLTSPSGFLSGDIPALVSRTNAKRANRAAERYAAEIQGAHSIPSDR